MQSSIHQDADARKTALLERIRLSPSGIPRYVQMKNQILGLIAEGRLRAGDQLPTMREMAEAAAIDVSTVKRCYDELAAAGAVEIRRPAGTFVSAAAPGREAHGRPTAEMRERARALAQQTLGEAATQRIDPALVIAELQAMTRR